MCKVSLAIPTYNREGVLLDSIREGLRFRRELLELFVVDQTAEHDPQVSSALAAWHAEELINWVRLQLPSLPRARNVALAMTRADILIFTDDDVLIDEGFVEAHRQGYHTPGVAAVAGRVRLLESVRQSRPAQRTLTLLDYRNFDYESTEPLDDVGTFWGCNHSVRISVARSLGGYDEGFTGSAVREETDLALRLLMAGHRIAYRPGASLLHLKSPAGGCRMTDYSRLRSEGLLYFAFKHRRTLGWRIAWDFWRAARASFLNKVVPPRWLPRQFLLFLRYCITRGLSA